MKKALLLLLILLPIVIAQTEITGYINDKADILSNEEEQQIEQIAKQLYDTGRAQYAIATVQSLEGRDIEGYAYEMAEGVLGEKEKNNGLLLLVALKDRKYRFEVGRGLEPVLPDIIMGRIGREYLVENFRAEEYGKGILEASRAVQARLNEQVDSEYYVKEDNQMITWIGTLMFITVILIIITIAIARKGRSDDDYFWAALMAGSLMGRGRSGGGFSGGFGGFGGGSFGGGGASGGW